MNCSCAVGTWWSIVKQPTESNDASEKGKRRRVADLDRHVGTGELVCEARGGVGVELERDEPLHAVPEPVGGSARPGADLEHLVPEIQPGRYGLEHLRLHELRPLGRAAEGVVLVHGGRR